MQVKKGNAIAIKVLAKDKQGNIITDLGTASEILFMVKINETDDNISAVISKSLFNGITRDDPTQGYIKIKLTSADTTIDVDKYYMALQINYPGNEDNQEIYLKENDNTITNEFKITQDIIR